MKNLIFLMCFLPIVAAGQFSDDFSDGNFTQNPEWNGSTSKFAVTNEELQLNDISASGSSLKAYLSTPSAAIINGSWQCKIKVNASMTSANYVRFYLIADNDDLTTSLKGYYIMVGGTAKEVSLYKQNGTSSTKIIDGTDNRVSSSTSNILEVKAERNEQGNWRLFSKLNGESSFVQEGECLDNSLLNAQYSGIYINYSSGNKDKYFFDDFVVSGNPYVYIPQSIKRNDVIINEIMMKPEPVVALPNVEYIELFNRSDTATNLLGWTISENNNVGIIEQGEIPAKGYILLCKNASKALLEPFGATATITSFPELTNASGLLVLKTDENQVITFTEYSDKWFGNDNFRKGGGFSLERIDADNLHNSAENWLPSQSDDGGTPCRQNSVAKPNLDNVEPQLTAVCLLADNSAKLIFNKEMNFNDLANIQNYFSEEANIISAMAQNPKNQSVVIEFSPALTTDTIEIAVKNQKCISDFTLANFSFRIAKPQNIETNDLVINELLFNSNSNTSTFAELFNKSPKVLDLSEIYTTRRYNGELDTRKQVTDEHILLFPNQYLLITEDINSVCDWYNCGDGLKIAASLPSLPNAEGNLVVTTSNATIIDEFAYTEKMHQNFVSNPKGVSLERINPYLPTQDVNNWHSASFDVNYGTPASQNSQYNVRKTDANKNFWLDYETFTPDNDGFRDFLPINYKFSQAGYTITANIYNPSGMKVKTLCNNAIAAIEGTLIWNGQDNSNSIARVGVYVIVIEAINTKTGTKIADKIVCVLSAK